MKILFVVNELNFFLRNHLNLANRINESNQVTLIADTTKSSQDDLIKLKSMGIILHSLNRKRGANKLIAYISYIYSLLKLIRKIEPKYILYITLELSFFGALIKPFSKVKKSIFVITGLGPFFFKRNLKYMLFNKVQQITFLFLSITKNNFLFVFLNLADQNLLSKKYNINQLNTRLIHGEGIDEKEFKFYERDNSNAKFLLASRLVQSKGIEIFIAAAKKIKKRFPLAEFSIAGIYDSNNPETISKELYKELKNSSDIKFLGEILHSNMAECLHENNIFVLISQREGLPKAAAEAASTGMPLILSNVPGCEDCVINNESGKLIPYLDEDELYIAMEYFISNPNQISLMGKKSSILAKEKLSLNVITNQYLKLFSQE